MPERGCTHSRSRTMHPPVRWRHTAARALTRDTRARPRTSKMDRYPGCSEIARISSGHCAFARWRNVRTRRSGGEFGMDAPLYQQRRSLCSIPARHSRGGRELARSSFLSRQLAIRLRDWREFRIYNVPPFHVTSTYARGGNGSIRVFANLNSFSIRRSRDLWVVFYIGIEQ